MTDDEAADRALAKFIGITKDWRETYVKLTLMSAQMKDQELMQAFIVMVRGCELIQALCEKRLVKPN